MLGCTRMHLTFVEASKQTTEGTVTPTLRFPQLLHVVRQMRPLPSPQLRDRGLTLIVGHGFGGIFFRVADDDRTAIVEVAFEFNAPALEFLVARRTSHGSR